MNDHELRLRRWKLALAVLLTAVAACILILDNLIGVSMFISPILAAVLLVPILSQCGPWPAIGAWAAASALAVWLVENPITSGLFVAFGYYPVLRTAIHRLTTRFQRFSVKFGYFNVLFCGLFTAMMFGLDPALTSQIFFGDNSMSVFGVFVLANILFLLFDFTISQMMKLCTKLPQKKSGQRKKPTGKAGRTGASNKKKRT